MGVHLQFTTSKSLLHLQTSHLTIKKQQPSYTGIIHVALYKVDCTWSCQLEVSPLQHYSQKFEDNDSLVVGNGGKTEPLCTSPCIICNPRLVKAYSHKMKPFGQSLVSSIKKQNISASQSTSWHMYEEFPEVKLKNCMKAVIQSGPHVCRIPENPSRLDGSHAQKYGLCFTPTLV